MRLKNCQSLGGNIKSPFCHKTNVKVAKDSHIPGPFLAKTSNAQFTMLIFWAF